MDIKDINKALVKASKADAKQAQELVEAVYLDAASVIETETSGAWPEGSLTKKMIENSPTLTAMFTKLSQEDRSEHIRDIKFTKQNYDAILVEARDNGWRKLSAIRKAIQKDQVEEPSEEETEETEEETGETSAEEMDFEAAVAHVLGAVMNAEKAGHDAKAVLKEVITLYRDQ
tara:strand:+ start:6553 stop:7074 length:522 start_codon:yes stop_codon:yes gene_type:complete